MIAEAIIIIFIIAYFFFQCLAQVDKESESGKLKKCASSGQGDSLLATYGDKSDTVQRPLAFVPTIIINEVCLTFQRLKKSGHYSVSYPDHARNMAGTKIFLVLKSMRLDPTR